MVASRFIRAWRAAVFAAGLAAVGLAQAANSYFLQIDGLQGDSTDARHKDWIDIESFSWGLTLATSGGSVGKATFSDLAWTQAVDSSTPAWFLDVATGKHIRTTTLDVVKAGEGGASFFQMIFTDTVGTGLRITGSGDGLMADASMSSGSIVKLRYRAQDGKGGYKPWVEGSFDLKRGMPTAQFSGDESVLLGLFASGGSIDFDAATVTPVPVPEPASAALLLAGLGVLALRRRRAG
ncbi:type VI secretion system tube protein Hcp [Roseateles sp.]|uniref:Hcp family type VI secretion system effector n=1 Tax=Roseateles sp. TaxID=1971397 RepID=UPI0025D75D86|nr:type VI secretion system tube protein Hcp [Roseateles sp.]